MFKLLLYSVVNLLIVSTEWVDPDDFTKVFVSSDSRQLASKSDNEVLASGKADCVDLMTVLAKHVQRFMYLRSYGDGINVFINLSMTWEQATLISNFINNHEDSEAVHYLLIDKINQGTPGWTFFTVEVPWESLYSFFFKPWVVASMSSCCFLYICYKLFHLPKFSILNFLAVIIFFADLIWNGYKLYEKEVTLRETKLYASGLQIPDKCFYYRKNFWDVIESYFGDHSAECNEYIKIMRTSPILFVNPGKVVAFTLADFIFEPLECAGNFAKKMASTISGSFPILISPVVFSFLFLLIFIIVIPLSVMLYYSILSKDFSFKFGWLSFASSQPVNTKEDTQIKGSGTPALNYCCANSTTAQQRTLFGNTRSFGYTQLSYQQLQSNSTRNFSGNNTSLCSQCTLPDTGVSLQSSLVSSGIGVLPTEQCLLNTKKLKSKIFNEKSVARMTLKRILKRKLKGV